MNKQSYLIDTNIIIGLEDNHTVKPAYSQFIQLSAKHHVDIFVHAAARDDIAQDKDANRRAISLSKLNKFQTLEKVRGLGEAELNTDFGPLKKHNDIVDATLLHAVHIGAADFLVTQDHGLHARALKFSADLARRVLFVADASQLLVTTFEPTQVPIRHVEAVSAHTIPVTDKFFDSLRDGYPGFDNWWKNKCVANRRQCWVVSDDKEIAGLIVHKNEASKDTDSTLSGEHILKICTFKVSPEKRGVKLGELLLKQALWYAQRNSYDLIYLTAYAEQAALRSLLEYYGFQHTASKPDGELILEKQMLAGPLDCPSGLTVFEADRRYYPRFISDGVRAFGIPIQEDYHDTLYPDLKGALQLDMFGQAGPGRPGNTIRKVYLCRAQSNLDKPGSVLFFYKSASKMAPSQAITSVGILESVTLAKSTRELMLLTGGRSVYSEKQLEDWGASEERPIKVINYLLVGYAVPAVGLQELKDMGIVKGKNPPQSIYEIAPEKTQLLIQRANLG